METAVRPERPSEAGAGDGASPNGREEFRDGVPFLGGRTWIDLVNTRPLDPSGAPVDLIATPAALAAWSRLADVPAPAPASPEAWDAEHDTVTRLRDALRDLFDRARQGQDLAGPALASVDRVLEAVTLRLSLEGSGDALRLVEHLDAGPSGAIAVDFARFICDFEPDRLKHCANAGCSMVFYDVGKNNRRRWCTMSICGNRDKVARFRQRHPDRG